MLRTVWECVTGDRCDTFFINQKKNMILPKNDGIDLNILNNSLLYIYFL